MIWLKRIGKVFAGLVALVALWLAVAALVYSPVYVGRVLAWGESDQGDYLNNFPLSSLSASPTVFSFGASLDEERVRSVFESILGVSDFDTFLAGSATQALIVIQDDKILYEGYFNGAARDSMVTSFSVAKSFGSALIGIAIDEGFIDGVDDSVADYLPELAERDDRFELITIRDLLINMLQLLFFMTPILYPVEWVSIPALAAVIRWANPFTPFTLAYQSVLFRGTPPDAAIWLHMAAWSALAWVLGAGLFSRLRSSLVEAV